MMVSELKDHLDRYREVLATLNVQGDSPARLEDVIGGSEPVTLRPPIAKRHPGKRHHFSLVGDSLIILH